MTGGGSTPFSYDGNGNLINDGTHTYTWDAENRLLSATSILTPQYRPASGTTAWAGASPSSFPMAAGPPRPTTPGVTRSSAAPGRRPVP